jgi:hypothetical protein
MKADRRSRGFALVMVLAIGVVLVLLGMTLFRFVGQQHESVHVLAWGEVAHLLAEAGISSSIRQVREALQAAGLESGDSALQKILRQPNPLADTSLMPYLKDSWNQELKAFAADVDKTASIRVEVWLRGFEATETDPSRWADPLAKAGWLSIEATGRYREVERTLTVKRRIRVASILPPLTSRFTLHLKDASRGQEGRFNVVRNDYQSNVVEGPRPLVCLNHATPDSPFEARSIGEILSAEADEQIWQKRGWIWLGGGKVRLNITSGAGAYGEIFHIYDVSNPNTFQPIQFKSPPSQIPAVFSNPVLLYWDRVDLNPARQVQYTFEHGFVFEGFHDKSSKKDVDAMYDGDILSPLERQIYTSRSNLLHLYGEARKGYQSRTRVLGRVVAAFPRFSVLQVSSPETDVQEMLTNARPLYPVPSMPERAYDPGREIKDARGRRVGGPILTAGMLFSNWAEYAKVMSGIVELPYVTSYNAMQDVLARKPVRVFPPEKTILSEDLGSDLEIRHEHVLCYKGPVEAGPRQLEVIQGRVQAEVSSIADFWDTYLDRKGGALVLDSVVRIRNPEQRDLFLPPAGQPAPLKVSGGGMIVLEQGNLVLGGVVVTDPQEALSIVLVRGRTITFASGQPNHVHLFAPGAEVTAQAPIQVFGSLAASDISPTGCTQGGTLRFREATDPSRPSALAFTKIHIEPQDSIWHE